MTIDRSTFLTPLPIKREEVALPEFGEGVTVWVYGLTAKEKAEHDSSMMLKDWTGISRTRAKAQKERMVIASVRDESGGRIFNPDDVKVISEWPAEIVERIVKVADVLNGVKDNTDAAKNSHNRRRLTAFRLAEFVEHTTDVDGMLDRMTPGQFDEWCAKDEVEPIGYSSRMLGLIAFQLATYMAGEHAEDVKAALFMPWTKFEPDEAEQVDHEAAGNYVRSIFGN